MSGDCGNSDSELDRCVNDVLVLAPAPDCEEEECGNAGMGPDSEGGMFMSSAASGLPYSRR